MKLLLLFSVLAFTSYSQDYMWLSGADTTKKDTIVFLTGTSDRLHQYINESREHKLEWDSVPGDFERTFMWNYRCDEILVDHLDNTKLHVIINQENSCAECERENLELIIKSAKKQLKKGKGYLFVSFINYGNEYYCYIITDINNKVRPQLYKL